VDQPPAITSASTASATVGDPLTFQVTATGYPTPAFSKSGGLPKGVTLSSAPGCSRAPRHRHRRDGAPSASVKVIDLRPR
jgi:hypothetical protein